MIKPFLKDEEFLADVNAARTDSDALHIWWLGQSGFLVAWQSSCLLLDPYLSDSLTRKYASTDKPHVRMTERVIAPDRLTPINVITSSHNHTDHLDAETITPLLKVNPEVTIIVPAANVSFAAERLKIAPERLVTIDREVPVSLPPFTFFAVPAAHESIEIDEAGNLRFIGLVVEAGPWALYHAGDTLCYPGMADLLRRWTIDLALLPINGHEPSRRVAGNMTGADAAQLAKDLGAGLVVPCHYNMFEFNTASPGEFIAEAERLKVDYRILQNGERLSLTPESHARNSRKRR